MASVFRRMFGRSEQRYMDAWFNIDPDVPYGRLIDDHRATRLSYVYSAIRFLVDYISTLPLDSYRANGDGTQVPIARPALFRNLDAPGQPGLVQWLGQAVFGMAVHGQAVGFITQTDGLGFPTMVRWVRKTDWQFDESTKLWLISGEPVPSDRIVHIPWVVPAGCTVALTPIEVYAQIIRAGLSAQEYADMRRGGGVPPVHLKNTARTLLPDDADKASKRAAATFAAGRPFVTGNDWDLTVPMIPPNYAQFIETMKLGATQIAGIYGISPEEIAGESANSLDYKTEESRELRRASDARPWLIRLEQAFNRILPMQQFVKLNVDATMRSDVKTRTDVIGAKLADGRLSVNEARALDDMPGIGTQGDTYNVGGTQKPTQPPQEQQPSQDATGDTP